MTLAAHDLVVLGAFGRTGWRLTKQARERGWRVLAADRKPDTAQGIRRIDDELLADLRGDDAPIVSALGPDRGHSGRAIGDFLEAVLEESADRRVVWIVGASVARPGDRRGLFYSGMTRMLSWRRNPAWLEKERELRLLEGSTARWTAVRPPRLRDDEDPGDYRADNPRLRMGSSIGRSTLARFVLDCVERDLFVREAPIVVQS